MVNDIVSFPQWVMMISHSSVEIHLTTLRPPSFLLPLLGERIRLAELRLGSVVPFQLGPSYGCLPCIPTVNDHIPTVLSARATTFNQLIKECYWELLMSRLQPATLEPRARTKDGSRCIQKSP